MSESPRGDSALESGTTVPTWIKGVAPLILLGVLVFVALRTGPVGLLRKSFPPVEDLTIERVSLPAPGVIQVRVKNGGPEAVTVAQVIVDDAIWTHTIDGDRQINRLESRTLLIPYPWVEGEPHVIKLLTNTGLTFEHEIAVATLTPQVTAGYLATFAALGIYVGIIPVFLGLLWLPFLRSVSARWTGFFLSLTIGLLIFLGVDALEAAFDTAGLVPSAYQGLGLITIGLLGAPLALAAVGRSARDSAGETSPFMLATLIAVGIGLHNLGEGLAVGGAYASGEIALGTLLVVGFLLHNTTEGLGIVSPISDERPTLRQLSFLGMIAGAPTVLGAWIGGFTYSPVWLTLFFAVGAGAIVQVVYQLWRFSTRSRGMSLAEPLNAFGIGMGLLILYATGLFVAV